MHQVGGFYQNAIVDFDLDLALESLLFVATHFIINIQLYCATWNRSNLRQLSTLLTVEINNSNFKMLLHLFHLNFAKKRIELIYRNQKWIASMLSKNGHTLLFIAKMVLQFDDLISFNTNFTITVHLYLQSLVQRFQNGLRTSRISIPVYVGISNKSG